MHALFGTYIKAARERAGLSVADAAKRVGIGADAIYRYERDANSPSIEMLDRLAAKYGALAGDLLPNTGSGSATHRFEPLAAAMLGLTDAEVDEQILILAAQARLNRNAITNRGSKIRPSVTTDIKPATSSSDQRKEPSADDETIDPNPHNRQ